MNKGINRTTPTDHRRTADAINRLVSIVGNLNVPNAATLADLRTLTSTSNIDEIRRFIVTVVRDMKGADG